MMAGFGWIAHTRFSVDDGWFWLDWTTNTLEHADAGTRWSYLMEKRNASLSPFQSTTPTTKHKHIKFQTKQVDKTQTHKIPN